MFLFDGGILPHQRRGLLVHRKQKVYITRGVTRRARGGKLTVLHCDVSRLILPWQKYFISNAASAEKLLPLMSLETFARKMAVLSMCDTISRRFARLRRASRLRMVR